MLKYTLLKLKKIRKKVVETSMKLIFFHKFAVRIKKEIFDFLDINLCLIEN